MDLNIDIKVGCDVVDIKRIQNIMSQPELIKKIFHPGELARFEAEHLAGIFAVKEAAIKALSCGPDKWLSLEICYEPSGKPCLVIANDIKPASLLSSDCSISHDGGLAFATVVLLQGK